MRSRALALLGHHAPSERLRRPQPLVRRRMPSGRGATEQPNATGDGEAELSLRFWAALLVTAVVTGVLAIALMALLFAVQGLAFGHPGESFQAAVEQTSPVRRVLVLLVAGAFGGPAWYLLRHRFPQGRTEIDDVLWDEQPAVLAVRKSFGSSVISEVVIGMGASIGREAAPKLMGGVSGGVVGRWLRLSPAQVRLLIACGGGAGLACVYNVPLGGTFFTAEVLLGTVSLATVLPALACSLVATVVAWTYLPDHATYLSVPDYRIQTPIMVWALVAGPLIGLVAAAYVRTMGWVSARRVGGRLAMAAPLAAFALLAVLGLAYPQLYGNGKDMAEDALLGRSSLSLLIALSLLKPLVTSACLGSGATGGLFTPTLSTGATLGGALGLLWSFAWPGAPVGAYALIGAAAMIGAAMQAPIAGLALVLELTHRGLGLMVAAAAATVLATLVTRYIDGYSIYSARLPARTREHAAGRASSASPRPGPS